MHRDASLLHAEAPTRSSLLLVGEGPALPDDVTSALEADFAVLACASRNEALRLLRELEPPPPVALVDLGPPPMSSRHDAGLRLVADLLAQAPDMKIIALTATDETARGRCARSLGAADFAIKAGDVESLRQTLRSALHFHRADATAVQSASGSAGANGDPLIGASPLIEKLRRQIAHYAGASCPLLIEGEAGSARVQIAAALHAMSPRSERPFRTVHCGRDGALRAIDSVSEGTLLLDEVGELPATAQAQLLQAIERVEAARGAGNLRVVAATSRDLRHDVRQGEFRRDLYCRLSAFVVNVPAVRDLESDTLLLLDHFRGFYAAAAQLAPFRMRPEATALWREYTFPGDLRELRHIVMRLTTRYSGRDVTAEDLAAEFTVDPQPQVATAAPPAGEKLIEQAQRHLQRESGFDLDRMLRAWEEGYVSAAMKLTQGNVSRAAKMLGLNRTTLYSRLESLRKPG